MSIVDGLDWAVSGGVVAGVGYAVRALWRLWVRRDR